jgi:hypothetical protein
VWALSGVLSAPDTELGVDANGVYGTTYGISTDAGSAGGGAACAGGAAAGDEGTASNVTAADEYGLGASIRGASGAVEVGAAG